MKMHYSGSHIEHGAFSSCYLTSRSPKTETTKSATISLEALHRAHDPVASACMSLHECRQDPHHDLDNINKQLDTIMTHLGIPSTTQTPVKPSYTSVLAAGTQCPTSPPNVAAKLCPPCARACFSCIGSKSMQPTSPQWT